MILLTIYIIGFIVTFFIISYFYGNYFKDNYEELGPILFTLVISVLWFLSLICIFFKILFDKMVDFKEYKDSLEEEILKIQNENQAGKTCLISYSDAKKIAINNLKEKILN